MKYISAILFSALVGLAIASLNENDTKLKSGEQNFEYNRVINLRKKRSIGADENFKKELEIKTKSGTTIKLSKSFSYNDGGAITLLPQLLDSIALNKVRIMEARRKKKGGAVVEKPSTTEPPVETGPFDFDPLAEDPAPSTPVEAVPVAPVDVAPAAPVEVVPPAAVVDTPAARVQAVPAAHIPTAPVVHVPVVAVNPNVPDCNQPTGHLDVHDGIHGGHHGKILNYLLAKHKKAEAGGLHGGHDNSLLGLHHGGHQGGYHNGLLGLHHGGYQGGQIGKHHGLLLAKHHNDFLGKLHESLHGKHHSSLYGKHHSDHFVGNNGLQSYNDAGPTKLQKLKQLHAQKYGAIIQKATEAILKIVEPKKIGPSCCPNGPCCPDRVQ